MTRIDRTTARVIAALASSRLPSEEIVAAIRRLQIMSPAEIENAIVRVRKISILELTSVFTPLRRVDKPPKEHPFTADDLTRDHVIDSIEALLIRKFSLSGLAASSLLIDELNLRSKKTFELYPAKKESFRRWLSRVSRTVPPPLLLYAAKAASRRLGRDERGIDVDWPLRR